MDRSTIESIGACSLDVESSIEMPGDPLLPSSSSSLTGTGTAVCNESVNSTPLLRVTHLPSYLNLACTVGGYSTTTNYDRDRLIKSRDPSPHRPLYESNTSITSSKSYCDNSTVHGSNTSPLLPLDLQRSPTIMDQQRVVVTRQQFYSIETNNYCSSSSMSTKFVDSSSSNGGSLTTTTTAPPPTSTTTDCKKSFIQQRAERLYGPAALAQGFFITKKRLNRSYRVEKEFDSSFVCKEKHSKSMNEAEILRDHATSSSGGGGGGGVDDDNQECTTAPPTLPVFRHLRPEFYAQLPISATLASKKQQQLQESSIATQQNSGGGGGGGAPAAAAAAIPQTLNDESIINGDVGVPTESHQSQPDLKVKDGQYFLKMSENESARLLGLASQVEEYMESDEISEEVKGKLRAASGKARLLTSQKIQQFKGLCLNNIKQSKDEVYPTTNEDLQGFWDMVLLQVGQLDSIFQELDTLRKNNWIEKSVPEANTNNNGSANNRSKRAFTNKSREINEKIRKQRELERKALIEEKRRAIRERQSNLPKSIPEDIQIYAPPQKS